MAKSSVVFSDLARELDQISPDQLFTSDIRSRLKTLPTKIDDLGLANLAYTRAVQIGLRKWQPMLTPAWPDPTNGKYLFHPEAIQRFFSFLSFLNKNQAVGMPSPPRSQNMPGLPVLFTLNWSPGSGPSVATGSGAGPMSTPASAIPQFVIDSKPVSTRSMNEAYRLRALALYGSDEELSEDEEGEEEPPSETPRKSPHTPKAPRRGLARAKDEEQPKETTKAPRSTKDVSSRPGLAGFPHLTALEQRVAACNHIVNQGFDTSILPAHIRGSTEIEAPKYDTNITGALKALNLNSDDADNRSTVQSLADAAAGTDYGIVQTDPVEPDEPAGSEDDAQRARDIAHEIQELDKQADSDPVTFRRACRHLSLDPERCTLKNPVLDMEIPLKPHQVGGAGSIVHWYNNRSSVRAGAVSDDAGTGKTRLTIVALEAIARLNEVKPGPYRPALVLCPPVLLLNWQREFAPFRKMLDLFSFVGDEEKESRKVGHVQHIGNATMARAFLPGGQFDPQKKETARCVVLCSYTTWAYRTLYDREALQEHLEELDAGVKKAVSLIDIYTERYNRGRSATAAAVLA